MQTKEDNRCRSPHLTRRHARLEIHGNCATFAPVPSVTLPPRPSWWLYPRVLRAGQWWYFAALPAAVLLERHSGFLTRLPLGVAVAMLALSFAYGINAIADRAMDTDRSKNPLVAIERVPKGASWFVHCIAVVALALSLGISTLAFAACSLSIAAAATYSIGPRLKAVPVVGTLLNVPIFAPLFYVALDATPSSPAHSCLVGAFAALLLQNQLLHEIADRDDDASGGIRTTALMLGASRVRLLALPLGPLAAVLLLLGQGVMGLRVILACGVTLGSLFFIRGSPRSANALRIAHRILSATVGAAAFVFAALTS
jgi:4-hydroxybenzoate polyprenyltransferase